MFFLETTIASSDTDLSFYSKYFFRKRHELMTFKKKTISLAEPFSDCFPLKIALQKSIHILWNVDSKQHRVQNTKARRFELQSQPLKAKSIQHAAASCMKHCQCTCKYKTGLTLRN